MKFKDKHNREWVLPELTLWHIKELRRETEISLDDIIQDGTLWNQTDDSWVIVGAMCWFWCQGQHEISEEDFFKSWDGEVFLEAQEALVDAIANFTPTKRREAIRSMAATTRKVAEMLPELTADQVKRIEAILSESVISGLARLASKTQTPTVSEPSHGLQQEDGTIPVAS